jgi:hypothetical protein
MIVFIATQSPDPILKHSIWGSILVVSLFQYSHLSCVLLKKKHLGRFGNSSLLGWILLKNRSSRVLQRRRTRWSTTRVPSFLWRTYHTSSSIRQTLIHRICLGRNIHRNTHYFPNDQCVQFVSRLTTMLIKCGFSSQDFISNNSFVFLSFFDRINISFVFRRKIVVWYFCSTFFVNFQALISKQFKIVMIQVFAFLIFLL